MLEETHKHIAEKIAQELKIEGRNKRLLVEGSVAPDSIGDFPHHKGKELKIFEDLLRALSAYEKNDDECYYELGKALHYIQDMWTARPGTPQKHTKWEQQISDCRIIDNSALEDYVNKAAFPTKAIEAFRNLLKKLVIGIDGVIPEEYQSVYLLKVKSLKTRGKLEEVIAREVMLESWKPKWTSLILADDEEGKRELNKYMFCTNVSEVPLSERLAKLAYYALRTHLILDSDGRPYSTPLIDLNFAYRTCLGVTRGLLSPSANWEQPIMTRGGEQTLEKIESATRFRIFPAIVGLIWLLLGVVVFLNNLVKYLKWSYIAAWMVLFGLPCAILFKLSFRGTETVRKISTEETSKLRATAREENWVRGIYREAFPELSEEEAELQETQEIDMDFEDEEEEDPENEVPHTSIILTSCRHENVTRSFSTVRGEPRRVITKCLDCGKVLKTDRISR